MGSDVKQLDEFLGAAKVAQSKSARKGLLRLAIEFRHPSWFDLQKRDSLLGLLKAHGAAFVLAHSSRYPYPEPEPVTADFLYLRFHGPEKMFASLYGSERLARWVPSVKKWLGEGREVFAYFNNDLSGFAVADAREILRLVGPSHEASSPRDPGPGEPP